MIYFIADYKLKGTISIKDVSELPEFEDEFIGWDTETTGLCPFYDKPILSILGDSEHQIVIDLISTPLELIEAVHRKYCAKTWIAHNAKFDFKMFTYHFPTVKIGKLYDTLAASKIIYNGFKKVKHSLASLSEKLLEITMEKETRLSFIGFTKSNPKRKFNLKQVQYAADDVKVLQPLKNELDKRIEKFGYQELIKLENNVMPVLAVMELKGMTILSDKWTNNAEKNGEELKPIEDAIKAELTTLSKKFPHLKAYLLSKRFRGEVVKYSSTDFWFDVFERTEGLEIFEERKDMDKVIAKAEARSDKKFNSVSTLFDIERESKELIGRERYSLGRATLEKFLTSEESMSSSLRRIIELILDYRKKSKEISTYGLDFLTNINPNTGKLHTEYKQLQTTTGRLASSKYDINNKEREGYNAQNIPKSKVLRECFVSDDPENYEILTADYSGQETILAASQSKDPKLLELAKKDLHSYLAQPSFRLIYDDPNLIVTKDINSNLRNKHKAVLFGIFYGARAARVAAVLNIPKSIAKKVYDNITTLLPEFFSYQRAIQQKAVKDGYITDGSKYKRRCWFTKDIAEHSVEKKASNYGMQSSGASMIKEALVAVEAYFLSLREEFPLVRILNTVHDEIICQIPKNRPDIALRVVEIMIEVGNSFVSGITIDVEYKVAPSWTK